MSKKEDRTLEVAFGGVIRQFRAERQYSQEELADRSRIHRTYVSQVERGEKTPSLRVLVKLAEALDVKPHALLLKMEQTFYRR